MTARRWTRRAGAGVLVAGAAAWVGLNAYAAVKIARSGTDTTDTPDLASVGLAFENVLYGAGLPAWYVPGTPGRPVIVVVHGYGGNRTDTVELGPLLHALGYGLLFPNLGYVSGVRPYGGGQREADEVAEAVGWVDAHVHAPVVLLAYSAGALASLASVARGTRVAAVVADSGFVGFRSVVAFRTHLPEFLTMPLPVVYPLVSDGGHVLDVARELDGRGWVTPTLLIHGDGDRTTPPSDGPRLARLTGGQLWMLPGVLHTKAFDTDRRTYIDRIDQFIRTSVNP